MTDATRQGGGVVIGLDPGPEQSAVVVVENGRVIEQGFWDNPSVVTWIGPHGSPLVAANPEIVIEKVESFGMAVGAEVFETVFWSGRFAEAWRRVAGYEARRLGRRDVKLHLCGTARAKDTNIRAALLDRFGPGKQKAIGTKATPGPLYGLTGHSYAALAVAVTWWDLNRADGRA